MSNVVLFRPSWLFAFFLDVKSCSQLFLVDVKLFENVVEGFKFVFDRFYVFSHF